MSGGKLSKRCRHRTGELRLSLTVCGIKGGRLQFLLMDLRVHFFLRCRTAVSEFGGGNWSLPGRLETIRRDSGRARVGPAASTEDQRTGEIAVRFGGDCLPPT